MCVAPSIWKEQRIIEPMVSLGSPTAHSHAQVPELSEHVPGPGPAAAGQVHVPVHAPAPVTGSVASPVTLTLEIMTSMPS